MRILHLIDHLGLGGAQALLLDLLEVRDRSDDHRVWTLADRPLPVASARLAAAGVPHRSLAMSKANPWGLARLRTWLARQRPDLLHTYLDYSNSLGVAAALAARRPRPTLVTQIDNDPGQHYSALPRLLLGHLASRVDAHVFVSESLRESSQTVLRSRCRRMEVIRPGIDLERFDPARIPTAEVAGQRAGASCVVGTVGRLVHQKAHEVLLDAVPALLAEKPGLRVVIIGEGPRRDELESRARALGVGHAVQLPGYRADVEVALAAMDVFAIPSRHEGFAISAIEAMAMEVPVVGTRVVGIIDAVGEDRGVLVPPDDAHALASAILRVLAEPRLRERLIRAGREWARGNCDRAVVAGKVRGLYEELAAETGGCQAPGGRA